MNPSPFFAPCDLDETIETAQRNGIFITTEIALEIISQSLTLGRPQADSFYAAITRQTQKKYTQKTIIKTAIRLANNDYENAKKHFNINHRNHPVNHPANNHWQQQKQKYATYIINKNNDLQRWNNLLARQDQLTE